MNNLSLYLLYTGMKQALHKMVFLLIPFVAGYGQNYVVTGENLVPNPSFEQTRACPKDADYIGGVVAWNLFPNFSADYFHRCANIYQTPEYQARFPLEFIQNFSVPNNMFGHQDARTGDAYAGVSFCYEALAVKLIRPLDKDSIYQVEFYVNLSDSSNVGTRYFGMYFSNSSVRVENDNRMQIAGFLLNEPPQVHNPRERYLIDTVNWMPVTGFYTAKGGEQYIAIGGFYSFHDSLVHYIRPNRALKKNYRSIEKVLGYYFVDDVSVVPYSVRWAPEPEKLYILDHVYFDFDLSALLPESYFELDKLVNYLQTHPNYRVTITGHTDNSGNETRNQPLSVERAKAVTDYLTDNGIEKERVQYKGAGSTQPIADNETKEGRDQNRRVEFRISNL
ncbi:MAG: OmpA family protein [Bacteroidales bacterium]|nr:OmpA family protein [Bacteroidales bacterium]